MTACWTLSFFFRLTSNAVDIFHVLIFVNSIDVATANFTLDLRWEQQIVIKFEVSSKVVNIFGFTMADVALEDLVGVEVVGFLVSWK
jgi:hypothetical protein